MLELPNVNNQQFLTTIFGTEYHLAHVTDFYEPPDQVPQHLRHICWAGGAFGEYQMSQGSNQYFCISRFHRDPTMPHRSLRRKNLFKATHCIVADDVEQKVPVEQAEKLPAPTWKLETSPGSQQWGWVLDVPCEDRHRVDNLLTGLVKQGLAPDGKDPGMVGTTRFVRLPEGSNLKSKYLTPETQYQGVPCRMLEWHPDRKVSIEALAAPFGIDLDAEVHDASVDLALGHDGELASWHPALRHIIVKSKIDAGKFDVTCPWVDGHTDGDDSGSAIFLLKGGKVGYRCHHGSCDGRTWADVLQVLPSDWMWTGVKGGLPMPEMRPVERRLDDLHSILEAVDKVDVEDVEQIQEIINATVFLTEIERDLVRETAANAGVVTKATFDKALKERRRQMKRERIAAMAQSVSPVDLGEPQGSTPTELLETYQIDDANRYVFVGDQNAFWDQQAQLYLSRDGYNGMHGGSGSDDQETPATQLLQYCAKASRVTYHPGRKPGLMQLRGVNVVNTWTPAEPCRVEAGGDVEPWLKHAAWLIPNPRERETLIQWMAWTLQNQNKKSNWQVLLGGYQGSGKDTLIQPLKIGIGAQNATEIPASYLLEPYETYLKSKLLIVQEIQNFERTSIQNKLKRILAANQGDAECDEIPVRMFGTKHIYIPNLTQTIFMSNHRSTALQVAEDDRRVFAVWSDRKVTKGDDKYFTDLHNWLGWRGEHGEYPKGYGNGVVIDYLMRMDLSQFNPFGRAPGTAFKDHLIHASRTALDMRVREAIEDQEGPFEADLVNANVVVKWLEQQGIQTNVRVLTLTLTRCGGESKRDFLEDKKTTYRYWIIRNHQKWIPETGAERARYFDKKGMKNVLFSGIRPVK